MAEPSPTPRRLLRRAALAIGIALVLLVVAVGGLYALVRANEPPWGRMEAALRSFPVPSNYSVTDHGRQGTDCWYNPTCQGRPQVYREIAPGPGQPAPDCNTLTTMVHAWSKAGYTDDRPITGGICDREGRIDGHPAFLSLGLGGGPGAAHPRNWVYVSVAQ